MKTGDCEHCNYLPILILLLANVIKFNISIVLVSKITNNLTRKGNINNLFFQLIKLVIKYRNAMGRKHMIKL